MKVRFRKTSAAGRERLSSHAERAGPQNPERAGSISDVASVCVFRALTEPARVEIFAGLCPTRPRNRARCPALDSSPISARRLDGKDPRHGRPIPTDPRQQLPPNWRRFYDQLIELRDQLIDAEYDMAQKAREIAPDPLLKDSPAEIGTSEFQRYLLLGMVTFDQETLDEVNVVLGLTARTAATASARRLEKRSPRSGSRPVPRTRYTLEAQKEMEARGQTPEAAIGPRGNMRQRGTALAGPWRDQEGST